MSAYDLYFLLFFSTILVTRIVLFWRPFQSPTVKSIRLHHWMYGLALMAISFVFSTKPLFAIGFGLFVDELTFILMKGRTHKDNYSTRSIIGTIALIMIAYFLRKLVFGF